MAVELADYQSQIAAQARLLRAAAVSVSAETPVPTCPGWTVQRLLQHVGRVFNMVIRVVQTADPQVPPPRLEPAGGDALAALDDRLTTMLDVLARTDPATPAWHFTPAAPKTAAFWSRRMAHEVTVHRIDAQAAAGTSTEVGPDFAADGVDEVLTRLIARDPAPGRPACWPSSALDGSVVYRAVDVGRVWTVHLAAGQLPQITQGEVAGADASVTGPADAVYRAAWGRPSGAVVKGDLALVEAIHAARN